MTPRARPRRGHDVDEPKVSIRDDEPSRLELGNETGPLDEPTSDAAFDRYGDEVSALDDDEAPNEAHDEAPVFDEGAPSTRHDRDEASDLDVGDVAEGMLDTVRRESARDERDDEGDREAEPIELIDRRDTAEKDVDEGEEGPAHELDDPRFEGFDGAAPMEPDEGDDAMTSSSSDGGHEEQIARSLGPPAFGLAAPSDEHGSVLGGRELFCAALVGEKLWLAGDGLYSIGLERLEASARDAELVSPVRRARVVGLPDEWITSLVSPSPRVLLAAAQGGRLYRSDDAGQRFHPVGSLGDGDASEAIVELLAQPGTSRVWARAHGGGLFRSDDLGRSWEGPVLESPVRAFAVDPEQGAVLFGTGADRPALLRADAEGRVEVLREKLPAAPVAIAARDGSIAVALVRGAGFFLRSSDRAPMSWPLLEGATAIAFAQTDDGAPSLLLGVFDDGSDRATLLSAAIADDGSARAAHRWADVTLGAAADEGEHEDGAIHTLVALDSRGAMVLALTGRAGVVLRAPHRAQ